MPRIKPITSKADLPPDEHALADAVVQTFGHIRGPFSMLLHSPMLAERILPLVRFFRDDSIVEPGLRSLAILTSAREHGAAYVWAAQVAAARRNGVREELIELIRAKADPGSLSPDERDVIHFARQLMRTNRVDAATFDALKSRHNAQWLVELTAAATYFAFVAGFANALEVPAPPDGDRLP
jgi:4-carboxymuconolactone decarboxylase